MNKVVGIDTNIFIYHFNSDPEFGEYTKRLFIDFSRKHMRLVTSIVTLGELLVSSFDDANIAKLHLQFAQIDSLEVADVDEAIVVKAAEIRRKYKFALPDALQLATALLRGADSFVTNDLRLKQFKELKVLSLTD